MNNFLLIFIFIFGTVSNLFSLSNKNLDSLQNEFHKKVVLTNIYKKRFNTYLTNKCKDYESSCIEDYIEKLNSWESTQHDKFIKNKLLEYKEQTNATKTYWSKINQKLIDKNIGFTKSEFVSIIDISRQLFILTLWNNKTKSFSFVGSDFISTGNINREVDVKKGDDHYFDTPNGIFKIKSGWRSKGKARDNNTYMPYGKKNRYVFYFGKQKSTRYNSFDKYGNKIKDIKNYKLITDELQFAMHAHKSSKKLGIKASHGCIRMTNELNLFLDNNLVLHKNNIVNNQWKHKHSNPPIEVNNIKLAGEYLIVIDKI